MCVTYAALHTPHSLALPHSLTSTHALSLLPPSPSQGVLAQTSRPWHKQQCFGPFALFDLHGKEDVPEGSASIVNRAEAEFVLCLYKHMLGQVQELQDGTASVAVISPYKAQVCVGRGGVSPGWFFSTVLSGAIRLLCSPCSIFKKR